MPTKRIESKTSRTAEMTCLTRAISHAETESHYHSDDQLAARLLPDPFKALVRTRLLRAFHRRFFAPAGIYEYVIARTKYIDAAFQQALSEGFEQVLIFGAGFDTRALRFPSQHTRVFELDAPVTQRAKIGQYQRRGLSVPPNLAFVPVDFDRQSLPERLDSAGFQKGQRSLFLLEGLLMYLQPDSVQATMRTIQEYAGTGSRIVFDYVRASVLRGENTLHGEARLVQTVNDANEAWRFALEPGEVAAFVAAHGFQLSDHKCVAELEAAYFQDANGRRVGRVNGTHCLVTAAKE